MNDKQPHSAYLKGKAAEHQAALFLRRQGYRILQANYRTPRGEIDLIAREGACLVFVEVKQRSSNRFGSPEEALTPKKRQRLYLAARSFLQKYPWPGDVRFDVVAMQGRHCRLYRNALEG